MPNFMIVRLQTSEIKWEQTDKLTKVRRPPQMQRENQNSTRPILLHVTWWSYMPNYMIVQLQTKNRAAKPKVRRPPQAQHANQNSTRPM